MSVRPGRSEATEQSLSVILERPHTIGVRRIPVPLVSEPRVLVRMGACGICGSDVRYFQGENPWSLHTLGTNAQSPPNMVLGHEVAGTVIRGDDQRRVAILAYRACGACAYCSAGQENLCGDMEHFGHSAGWKPMPYYPGGMAHLFTIWKDFAYPIPDPVSFVEATFLDGLAVAIHSATQAGVSRGRTLGVLGLGPIGLLAAQVARARGASEVCGCDVSDTAVRLTRETGFDRTVHGDTRELRSQLQSAPGSKLDCVVDTVGTEQSIADGLAMLDKGGTLALLAVHDAPIAIRPVALSGERRLVTSSNNRYAEFPEAIELLGSGAVRVSHLVTHRFPLDRAPEAFSLLMGADRDQAYKVVLLP